MTPHPVARARTLRGIAVVEAIKGIVVLAASIGLLSLLHQDMHQLAHEVVRHFSMQPSAHYPTILLHYADLLDNINLRSLVLLAFSYAVIRLIEAYGLWNELAWGEWLGVLSGGIYIPFEIVHFVDKPSAIGATIFFLNVFIVGFLAIRLYRRVRIE